MRIKSLLCHICGAFGLLAHLLWGRRADAPFMEQWGDPTMIRAKLQGGGPETIAATMLSVQTPVPTPTDLTIPEYVVGWGVAWGMFVFVGLWGIVRCTKNGIRRWHVGIGLLSSSVLA